jgi:hypothetical protein
MTRADIKAELRRSACEDADPWYDMSPQAFWRAVWWYGQDCGCCNPEIERLFFLIVAEAM